MKKTPKTLVDTFPVTFRIADKLCVFVGRSVPVIEKVLAAFNANARIRIISTKLPQEISSFEDSSRIDIVQRPYNMDDLNGAFLVFAGADDPALNAQIADQCRHLGIACARLDAGWEEGDFFVPSSIEYQHVLVSVSSRPEHVPEAQHVRRMLRDFLYSTKPLSDVRQINPEKGIIIVTHHINHGDASIHFLDQVDYLRFQMIEAAIEPAFVGGEEMTLADAVHSLLERGVRTISVLPFFLCRGRRWFEGVPTEVREAIEAHGAKGIEYTILDPIGVHPIINDLLLSIASNELA